MRLLGIIALFLLTASAAVAMQEDPQVPRVGNPHGNMDLDCKLCHSENSWEMKSAGGFDHATTGFPLEGLHQHALCRDCHKEPVFAHVGTQCADCHTDAHRGRLGPVCSDCHTPNAWVDQPQARQDHNATAMPLVGAHERVDCDACHSGAVTGDYVGTPTNCYACHSDTYAGTDNPDHQMAGFSTDCERCHGVFSATWGRGDFIHSPNFPLTGAHSTTACVECHSTGFAGTPTACSACHQPQYDNTTNPAHLAAGFPNECALCHNTTAWQPGLYDHNATAFPLTGSHRTVDCASCHATTYVGTPTECVACHQTDYDGTTDPNHAVEQFPTDCRICHNTTDWGDANFDHNLTAFALTGAHRTVDCASCHTAGYTGTPTACVACHQDNFDNTTDPNHVAAQFPTECATCHTTTAWEPSSFDHNATAFALTGAHMTADCLSCHSAGYSGTPTACVACHQTNYDNTTDPNHAASQFPTECAVCHTTAAWQPADFDHNLTAFPLTGAHTSADCLACHSTGYSGTPTACVACHQNDYDNTNDPNHLASNFPVSCQNCHTTNAWEPSTWDHNPLFPITTGRHRNVWNSCATCHTVQSNYAVFECILCHEHNRTDMDRKHEGRRDYQYLSTACYQCHPRGNAD